MIDYNQLDEDFLEAYQKVRVKTLKEGFELRPIRGFINIFDHSERWRAINSDTMIMQAVQDLERQECLFLSNILFHSDPGKNLKDWHPRDLPGFNWHNWGKALDLHIREVDFNSHTPIQEKRQIFKDIAESEGLFLTPTHTLNFDVLHIQNNMLNPSEVFVAKEIDTEMYRRYQDGD